jgi:hypothetical protein
MMMEILHVTSEKIRNIVNQRPLLFVAVLSGLAGLCLGLSNATWQASVETGQALAGVVKYPPDNPFYMYHLKAFSIINHLSAALLLLLDSEIIVSFIISGLLGMVSFLAISILIFSICRNVYISVLGILFIFFLNYVGKGVQYPIDLLVRPGTFGILGLSFIVLVTALIAAKSYRMGLFCLGLAPYVHVSLAAGLFLFVLLASFLQPGFAKKIAKAYYVYFLAGMLISVSGLFYQLYLMQNLPKVAPEIKNLYLNSFMKYWDYHRRAFYWDFETGQNSLKEKRGIIFCLYSIIAVISGLKYFKKDSSISFLFRVIAISGTLSLLLALLTHLPTEKIPPFLLVLMPGRLINFNNIIMPATLLAMLVHPDIRSYVGNYYVFVFFLIVSFFSKTFQVQLLCFAIITLWLAYMAFGKKPS